jgi:hypothetical protein
MALRFVSPIYHTHSRTNETTVYDSSSAGSSTSCTGSESWSSLAAPSDAAASNVAVSAGTRQALESRWAAPLPLDPPPHSSLYLSLRTPWTRPSSPLPTPSDTSLSDSSFATSQGPEPCPKSLHWRVLTLLARLLSVHEDTWTLLTLPEETSTMHSSDNSVHETDSLGYDVVGRLLCSELREAHGGFLLDGLRTFAQQDDGSRVA